MAGQSFEKETKKLDESFNILLDPLPEGVVFVDLFGIIKRFNKAFLSLYGLNNNEDIVGKSVFSLIEDRELKCIRELMDIAGEKGAGIINDFETSSSEQQFFDIQVVLMRNNAGESVGFAVITFDTTKKIISEIALRESEARNRALLEAVPDIMFRVNRRGKSLDNMLADKIDDIFPPEVISNNIEYLAQAIDTREIQIIEYGIPRDKGKDYYEARFVAIEDDEVLIILRNVTERSQAMQEIEQAKHEAELANRSKSDFLANMSHEIRTPLNSITGFIELLLRTDVNESQREFLSIIRQSASNLLQLINDILDFSKIESNKMEINNEKFNPFIEFESILSLFDVRAKEKGILFVSYIDPNIPEELVGDSLRLKQVLSNLLSNAVKFTPRGEYVITEITLISLEEDCLLNFSVKDTGIGIAESKQKKIFESFTQADSSVTRQFGGTGLGLSISQNLVRLLGGELELESSKGKGCRFFFNIRFGVGSTSSLSKDFEKYSEKRFLLCFQGKNPLSQNIINYFDTLPLNYESSENLKERDGNFDLIFFLHSGETPLNSFPESEKGMSKNVLISASREGTLVSPCLNKFDAILTFPIKPGDLISIFDDFFDDKMSLKKNIAKGDSLRPIFHGNVLVGEDNKINQKLIGLLLKDYGLKTDIAGNGLDVFEMFRQGNYDLVLMDLHMPISDGFESTGMIRDYEKEMGLPPVPIVALSAKVLKGDRASVVREGMDDFLSKPIVIDELERVLQDHLKISDEVGKNEEVLISLKSGNGEIPIFEKYDLEKVSSELMIPVDALKDIIQDFFDDGLVILNDLKKEVFEGNLDKILQLAHQFKGAAANLRFNNLSHLALKIEENSNLKNKEFDYSGILDTIENELLDLQSIF